MPIRRNKKQLKCNLKNLNFQFFSKTKEDINNVKREKSFLGKIATIPLYYTLITLSFYEKLNFLI